MAFLSVIRPDNFHNGGALMVDGPIYRSPDESAEYRLSQAERAGVRIIELLPDDVKAKLCAWLEVPRD